MNSKSSIKKGNLLQILLYALSPIVENKKVDRETGEITTTYHHVYSESNRQTANKIGISDKTINHALSVLSGLENDGKPLIFYANDSLFINGKHITFPDIYVENVTGWQESLNVELKYYENRIKLIKEGKRID